MFEARAMAGQFRHYTQAIDLWPCGGDPSLDYKDDMRRMIKRYQNGPPIHVLYFGDADKKGEQIPESLFATIERWASDIDFTWEMPGLSIVQGREMDLPQKIEGTKEAYQWESLSDPQASKIIKDAFLAPYWDEADFELVTAHEKRLSLAVGSAARRAVKAQMALRRYGEPVGPRS